MGRGRGQRTLARWRDQQGIAVPVVLWLVVIVVMLTAVAARTSLVAETQAQRSKESDAALQAADAAIQYTIFRLNQTHPNPGSCPNFVSGALNNSVAVAADGWCPAENNNFVEGNAYANVRVSSGAGVTTGCQSSQQRKIVAVGIANLQKKITRTVTATVSNGGGGSMFAECGVLASEWIKTFNKSKMFSNVASTKYTKLMDHSVICGDLHFKSTNGTSPLNATRPDNPSSGPWPQPWLYQVSSQSPGYLCGAVAPEASAVSVADVPMPALSERAADNSLVVANGATTEVGNSAANDYQEMRTFGRFYNGATTPTDCSNANFSYKAATRELVLSGGTASNPGCSFELTGRVYRFCKLQIGGGARLIIPPAQDDNGNEVPVKIYIEDNQIDNGSGDPSSSKCTTSYTNRFSINTGGTIENQTGNPNKLWIVSNGAKVKGNGQENTGSPYRLCFCNRRLDPKDGHVINDPILATVVAPRWMIEFERFGTLEGGMAAKRIQMRYHSLFRYSPLVSELPADQAGIALNYSMDQDSWRECGAVPVSSTTFTNTTC